MSKEVPSADIYAADIYDKYLDIFHKTSENVRFRDFAVKAMNEYARLHVSAALLAQANKLGVTIDRSVYPESNIK